MIPMAVKLMDAQSSVVVPISPPRPMVLSTKLYASSMQEKTQMCNMFELYDFISRPYNSVQFVHDGWKEEFEFSEFAPILGLATNWPENVGEMTFQFAFEFSIVLRGN